MKIIKTAAVIMCAAVLLAGYSFGKNDDTDKQKEETPGGMPQYEGITSLEAGNTNGNITNMGGAAYYGKKVYYQNGEDNYKIYKSDKNGKNEQKLNDATSYFINVIEDYVYYCNADDDYHIYRMKTDGSENEMIYDHSAYYLVIENGFMYFSDWDDNKTLYRMELDGSQKWQLSEIAAYYINVIDDDVYYCNYDEDTEDYGIYTVNFVTKQTEKICAYICGYLNVTDNYLYFTDMRTGLNKNGTDGLYTINRYNYDETNKIIDGDCGTFNVDGNYIYYINYDDEDKIYRCDVDGKNAEKYVDEQAKYVVIANKTVYYLHNIDDETIELKSISFKDCLA